MTVSAETDSFNSVWSGIRVAVACIAYSTLCIVPDSLFITHKSGLVCFGISSFNTVIIKVALYACRIAALNIMA